jgi:hypothetical protein
LFGELPKIFGKEFLIGHFLPAAVFFVAAAIAADLSGSFPVFDLLKKTFVEVEEKKLAFNLGFTLLLVWAVATLLLVLNFKLIRVLEGYGAVNPARLLKWRSLRLFDQLNARVDRISEKPRISNAELSERRRLRTRLANEFPEQRNLVLPTRFGNVVRAFERYPQIIYNIEAIRSWIRLQAVLPEAYKNSLDAAKTVLDFFVHIWFGSVVIAVAALLRLAYVMSSHIDGGFAWTLLVISGCGAFSALLAAKSAQEAAGQWGELVKAAFDLYRGDLCKQLGFELPREIERERRMWAPICRTMIYRQARYAAEFTEFRPAADRKPDDS